MYSNVFRHGDHSKDRNDYHVPVNDKTRDERLRPDEGSFELEAGELRDDEETSPKHKKKKKKKNREEKKSKDEGKINEKLAKKHKSKKSKRKHKDSEHADLI